jgi:hypothetical protein
MIPLDTPEEVGAAVAFGMALPPGDAVPELAAVVAAAAIVVVVAVIGNDGSGVGVKAVVTTVVTTIG